MNREKLTAWNAETAVALLALSQSSGRKDLRDVALRTLEFINAKLVTEKGAFALYQPLTGQRIGEAQVDANAWAALGLLEGYRSYRSNRTVGRRCRYCVSPWPSCSMLSAALSVMRRAFRSPSTPTV